MCDVSETKSYLLPLMNPACAQLVALKLQIVKGKNGISSQINFFTNCATFK